MSLHDALIKDDFPKARRLICRRDGINDFKDGETPLMLAALQPGKEYLTQLLLTAGANVDMQNEVGETALMLALHSPNNKENVSILLHARTDTNPVTRYGYAACDYALKHPCYDCLFPENTELRDIRTLFMCADLAVVEVVCKKQVLDINLLRLVLMDAVYSENIAKTELLLKLGAPATSQTYHGWSALMQAVCRAHLELVKLLLRYGADPSYQDHERRTALSEMATCAPGLRMTELIYCEEYALETLGMERLAMIKAAQSEIERLIHMAETTSETGNIRDC